MYKKLLYFLGTLILYHLQPFQILIGIINLITLNYDQYKFIHKICFTFSVVNVMSQYKHITKSNTINNHQPSPTTNKLINKNNKLINKNIKSNTIDNQF